MQKTTMYSHALQTKALRMAKGHSRLTFDGRAPVLGEALIPSAPLAPLFLPLPSRDAVRKSPTDLAETAGPYG